MNSMGYIKAFKAAGMINKRRIVTFGTAEGEVVEAAAGDAILGVSGIRGAKSGETVDVYLDQIRDVELGGAVAYGDWLTSDADGKAVKAEPEAGVAMAVIGRAMVAGNAGELGEVLVAPQMITG